VYNRATDVGLAFDHEDFLISSISLTIQ